MRRGLYLLGAAATAFALAAVVLADPAPTPELTPFGHACTPEEGVRFCSTADLAARVPSFDGVPLDVDVTLPEAGEPPYPAIVMLHGFGGTKADYEAGAQAGGESSVAPGSPSIYHYDNVFYARRGYAVVNYTARGFGHSGGYSHLADSRFEARDTQYLLGLLADEGVVRPREIGVTGISYGGGQSLELAFLHDKVRLPNGKLAPWRSPAGKPMAIAAAYPRLPWSDLVSALVPNGRFKDWQVSGREQSLRPVGTPLASFLDLYVSALKDEASASLGKSLVDAGRPLSGEEAKALKGMYWNHGAYPLQFLKGASKPAPLLIENGFTDELFPIEQALRVYDYLRSQNSKAPVALQFADLGHSRATGKPRPNYYFDNQAARFFAAHLLGAKNKAPAPGLVSAFTTTCPESARDGGPYKASSWSELHAGDFLFGSERAQEFTSGGGSAEVARAFDPISGTGETCKTIPLSPEENTATYSRQVKRGFTLLGQPTIEASISTAGRYGQIDARLWDISPEGTQLLVDRGTYSLENNQSGLIAFQLHGNAYRFAKDHRVELQLLGRDTPYYQPGSQF
ncbi:MAG: CocE/NonD family hydrolase, partial [Solirubrobacterales bacterium]